MSNMFDRAMNSYQKSQKISKELVTAMNDSLEQKPNLQELQDELIQLRAKLEKYELALDQEVWNSKKGKFVPVRELPWVAKVLE